MSEEEADSDRFGYRGSPELWSDFLRCWTEEAVSTYSLADELTPMEREILETGRQGFAPATQEQIQTKERQLGLKLPKSYRDFLLASNGWRQPALDYGDGLVLPIERVARFEEAAPEFYAIATEYIDEDPLTADAQSQSENGGSDYSANQDPVNYEVSHFLDSVAISEETDAGIYLLNTQKKSPESELEVWFYSANHPGVYRFVSFAHLMQYAYIKATKKPEYDIPYDSGMMEGTCAEILGFPKIR